MSITEKLIAVQKELNVPKDRKNTFGGFNYRSAEDILEKAKPICHKHGLLLVVTDKIAAHENRYYIQAIAKVTDGENAIEASGFAREAETKKGMDESQITGATSSYARKYALNGLFAIDDTKDADTDEHHHQTQPQTAPQPTQSTRTEKTGEVSDGQVKFIMSLLSQLGAQSDEDKKELLKETTGEESIKSLTKRRATEVIDVLKSHQADQDIDLGEQPFGGDDA